MKAIAAMSENRAIGKNGGLPWAPIKADFAWFKEFTTGKILVMGWNTANTLPPLKNRNKIVVSTKTSKDNWDIYAYEDYYDPITNSAQTYMLSSCVIELDTLQPDLVCIGGAKTYELFLPYITEFYVTHVKGVYDCDVFMPPFEHLFSKQELIKEFDGHRVVKYSK